MFHDNYVIPVSEDKTLSLAKTTLSYYLSKGYVKHQRHVLS